MMPPRKKLKSMLEEARQQWINEKQIELNQITKQHQDHVIELFHLQFHMSMLNFTPGKVLDKDGQFEKFYQKHSLTSWTAHDVLASDQIQTRQTQNKRQEEFQEIIQNATHHSHHTFIPGSGIKNLLSSFVYLEDDQELSCEQETVLAQREAQIADRISYYQAQGLLRGTHSMVHKVSHTRQFNYHTKLLYDAIEKSRWMDEWRKERLTTCKKVSKAIQRYWELKVTERARLEKLESKRIKRMAKEVANIVKKQWKLAEQIVNAKMKLIIEEEQHKAGKRHLNEIIEKSSRVLKDQQMEWQRSVDSSDSDTSLSDDDDLATSSIIEDEETHTTDGSDGYDDSDSAMEEDVEEHTTALLLNDEAMPLDDAPDVDHVEDDTLLDKPPFVDAENEQQYSTDAKNPLETSVDHTETPIKDTRDIHEQSSPLKHPDETPSSPVPLDKITSKPKTLIPPLLKHTLREYQHEGLDWLANLNSKGLNGILADEMGLGKTIQTISLLAYLAYYEGIWGPHLIVVPTSVMLNWEYEFKKWCPGLKILTYYGNQKERKEKRHGWSKLNTFHVCITSYQIVLQDQKNFRRKFWHYMILDEAHNIKNFRSQRWQTLLTFNSERRLLLTGTPLQNNLIELWSLLYFLMPKGLGVEMMPAGFASQKEFQDWFSSPVDKLIDTMGGPSVGSDEESRETVQKLHTILRPFLLRRLKSEVEKQMPAKIEHVVYCRLSRRQRFLYDDFMSRAKTRADLASGNYMSILNCLMQLRKVCNHPDLFEVRPIVTSFVMSYQVYIQLAHIISALNRLYNQDPGHERTYPCYAVCHRLGLVFTEPKDLLSIKGHLEQDTPFELMMSLYQKHIDPLSETVKDVCFTSSLDYSKHVKLRELRRVRDRWARMRALNKRRLECMEYSCLNYYLVKTVSLMSVRAIDDVVRQSGRPFNYLDYTDTLRSMISTNAERLENYSDTLNKFACLTPCVIVRGSVLGQSIDCLLQLPTQASLEFKDMVKKGHHPFIPTLSPAFHPIQIRLQIAFPDKYLLQYDCGKLQTLDKLLRDLKAGGHRALIFTQMTRMLDTLESFLNLHGHIYLRLDGTTKVEQRQILMDRFNNDPRILCFILSTRSGGVGMNLVGADSVIFYDSDWNPAMDAQAQDRAHRIGQTRNVHIYRFITEHTVEENMLKKANKKRALDNLVIQQGQFTTDYFKKMHWKDWLEETEEEAPPKDTEDASVDAQPDWEQALVAAEDEVDVVALKNVEKELKSQLMDFQEVSEGTVSVKKPDPGSGSSLTQGIEMAIFRHILWEWKWSPFINTDAFLVDE